MVAGIDVAAVDGNGPAAAASEYAVAAADGRAVARGCGGDRAAVDDDGAAAAAVAVASVASYDRIVVAFSTRGDQLADIVGHIAVRIQNGLRLPVDGQGVGVGGAFCAVILHLNAAVDCEGAAICQDQADVASDGDALGRFRRADGDIAGGHIPAGCPFGVAAGYLRGAVAGLRRAGFVQIGHICHWVCRQCHSDGLRIGRGSRFRFSLT